jgi:hypothetical protein
MSAQHTAVLEGTLAPADERHRVSTSDRSEWSYSESAQLTSTAFDVVIASSETEARRAANEYRRLCLRSRESSFQRL